jgi:Tol biopolymer transport system component
MGLSRGTQLGSCEILELLGTGGMGEVYRGRDTRLGRDVAIKALPAAFAQDRERLARFEREAQVLAALNHPSLAVIHELKEFNGAKYLILELVEGETLAERIARGPLPLAEALALARQIAQAMEAAHEKGIVHRDLKPSNIKITPEGRLKVLDFGLAKFYLPDSASSSLSQSPTLSAMPPTGGGVILGTAAYMSPEQARGRSVDRRADIWAFGCVLYEMLTGKQVFPNGETITDTLAGILAREPDLQALPAGTPARIRALLERCLRKDERRRLRDIGNARLELEETGNESETAAPAAAPSRRREFALAAAALIFFAATAGIAARLFLASGDAAATRFDAALPAGLAPNSGFTVSPDGERIAYVTSSPRQVWVRRLSEPTAQALRSTEGASANIFWSADSRRIGFFAEGQVKTVLATGGPAQTLAALPSGGNYSGTWNDAGVLLIGSDANAGGPLLRLPAGSGQPAPATDLDASRKEESHRYPSFLPDGRHFLYLAVSNGGRDRQTYVGELDSKDRRPLEGVAAEARYAGGHVLFIRDGALIARPFDPGRREFTGEPFPLADPFAPRNALTHPFSVSNSGILSYRAVPDSAAGDTGEVTQLTWYNRNGEPAGTAGPEGVYFLHELSPDGKSVAFARGGPPDIYMMDLETGRDRRITSDPAIDANPRWSPDGKWIAFDSTRDGAANLYIRAVGVSGEADRLVPLKTDAAKTLSDWSPDGKYLVYISEGDIWAVPVSLDSKDQQPEPKRITETPFMESDARVSTDGKWIAYVSNEEGRNEVYVRSFPDPGPEYPVSTEGAYRARWSPRDLKELFYVAVSADGRATWMAVPVKSTGSALTLGAPALLPLRPRGVSETRSYSVSADNRFLLQDTPRGAQRERGTGNDPAANPAVATTRGGITVIVNWLGGRGH